MARDKSRRDPCTGQTGAGLDKVLAALQAELDGIATDTRVKIAAVKEDEPTNVCDAACRQAIEDEVNKAFAGKTAEVEPTEAPLDIKSFYNYYNSHKLGRVQKVITHLVSHLVTHDQCSRHGSLTWFFLLLFFFF